MDGMPKEQWNDSTHVSIEECWQNLGFRFICEMRNTAETCCWEDLA
jgi:hypothetical protein